MVIPGIALERKYRKRGYKMVAGIDEVGRGSLAGPVAAAAVIFPKGICLHNSLLRDSKTLTPAQRERVYPIIMRHAEAVGVGMVSNRFIDRHGIVQAVIKVFSKAVENLSLTPDFLLVDGILQPSISIPFQTVVRGESVSMSIAAASIVAKVRRDALMKRMARRYVEFSFDKHKGYGTELHRKEIYELGLTPLHRRTFITL